MTDQLDTTAAQRLLHEAGESLASETPHPTAFDALGRNLMALRAAGEAMMHLADASLAVMYLLTQQSSGAQAAQGSAPASDAASSGGAEFAVDQRPPVFGHKRAGESRT